MKVQLACLLALVVYCSALKGRKIKLSSNFQLVFIRCDPPLASTLTDHIWMKTSWKLDETVIRPNCDTTNGRKVDGFSCGDGQCIWKSLRCDGRQDCFNNFDEEEVICDFESYVPPYVCSEDEFDCGDGNCISSKKRCDGHRECDNGKDEKNCDDTYFIRPNCDEESGKPITGVNCGDGHCIFENQLCDDKQDCMSGMDESPATCPKKHKDICTEKEFQCASSKQCVPLTDRCDGTSDCKNNYDEHNCPSKKCAKGKIDCGDGQCYKVEKLCDGEQDCFNNADEKHCTPKV